MQFVMTVYQAHWLSMALEAELTNYPTHVFSQKNYDDANLPKHWNFTTHTTIDVHLILTLCPTLPFDPIILGITRIMQKAYANTTFDQEKSPH
jgi:hypothetical protein